MIKKLLQTVGISWDGDMIGSISEFAGNRGVRFWAPCSGQIFDVKGNEALFSILGTKYGGDGIKTFALPDLRPLDKNGKKIEWRDYSGPMKMICIQGGYPSWD
jgi:microcystin-dependent protein